MAGEYNASAKFDSSQAERGINSLAGKIEGLKGKLQGAAAAGKSFDSSWSAASRTMSAASTKARQMESSLASVSRGAKTATSSMRGFAGALNTGEMARAAGVIRSLGTHLTNTSTRMRQIRTHAAGLQTNLTTMTRMATAAALGIERLGSALTKTIPKMMQGSSAAKSLASSLGFLQRSYSLNVTGMGSVTSALKRTQTAQNNLNTSHVKGKNVVNQYSGAVHGLNGSILGLGSGLAGVRNLGLAWLTGMGVSGLANLADTFKLTAARLSLVTEGTAQLTAAQAALMDSSNRTRTSFKDNVNLFTKMAQAGKAYGLSLEQSLQITENVQKAFKISGASTGESQAASQQLAQAFASGRLQGDELRSILENAPRLGRALSEQLGIPLGEIRKRAKDGEIGIREMIKAFGNAKISSELADEMKKIPVTIGDAFQVAQNKLTEYIGGIDKAGGISKKVADIILKVADNFQLIGSAAVFAGTMILVQYIPNVIKAIKVSKEFIALKWASYGAGVAGALSNAVAGLGLFKGALTKSATSTLPMWKQVVGNVTAAAGLNIGNMVKLFSSAFMRLPAIFAIGTVALYAFNDDTKIVEGELATTQDYLVSGFEIAWNKIADIVSSISDFISTRINKTIDDMVWFVDQLYRLGKVGVGAVIETGKLIASLAPGGKSPEDAMKGLGSRVAAYGNEGLRQDIGQALKGTSWNKAANDRAWSRFNDQMWGSKSTQDILLGGAGGDIAPPPSGGGGTHKTKKKKDDTAEDIKRTREELDRLNASFSDAEAKRQDFNQGLLTLRKALQYNIIDASQFDDKLRRLAHETFPGLRDELKTLQQENKDLVITATGGTKDDVDIAHAKDTVDEQINQIDVIIAKQGDVNGVLSAQKDALQAQLGDYIQMKEENKDLTALADKRKQAEEDVARVMEDGWSRMSDLFTQYTSKMLSGGRISFKNFFKDILGMARDIFSEMMNAMVFQPMHDQIMGWMQGLFGAKKPAARLGSQAVGDAMTGATGTWKDLKVDIPPIKIDVNGQTASASGGSDTVNLNVNPTSGPGAQESPAQDIVVTGHRMQEGFFPGMMRGYKESWQDTFKDLGKLFKPVGDTFKRVGEKLGISADTMGKVGATIGKGFAGAQKGMMVNSLLEPLGKALGFKTSKTGAAIGGAIGSFIPIPGGDIIGSIIGSIVGGLFKKTKKAAIALSTGATGRFDDNVATGNDGKYKKAVTELADSVKSGIYQLASSLGGDVASNFSLGSITFKKNKFRFGGEKYATEAEAIEAMIKDAIHRGIITGLSATSDKVLKTFKDTDRAIQIVQTIESIKKQAAAIRNPTKAMFEDLKKDIQDTIKMFQEAGASSEDYADLATVAQSKFKDIVDASLKQLQDFRFDLTGGNLSYLTPADRLAAASDKFKSMEADIASGKAVDPSTFTEEAGNLVSLARDVYGSTPEFAEFQARVLAATDAMISNTQAQVDAYQPVIDAILNQTAAVTEVGTGTNDRLDTLIDLLGGGGGGGGGTFSGGGGLAGGVSFDLANF